MNVSQGELAYETYHTSFKDTFWFHSFSPVHFHVRFFSISDQTVELSWLFMHPRKL